MQYYMILSADGKPVGPFDLHELPARGLTADTMVWCEGMKDWAPATSVPEVACLIGHVGAATVASEPSDTYYLAVNGRHTGPYTAAQLREQGVVPSSMVWRQGMAQWEPVSAIPALSEAIFGGHASLYGTAPVDREEEYMSPDNIHPLEEPVTECPPSHLGLAIAAVVMLFPFSIGVLVKSILVKVRWNERRYGDAVWLSKTARRAAITCIIVGAVFITLYVLMLISMPELLV